MVLLLVCWGVAWAWGEGELDVRAEYVDAGLAEIGVGFVVGEAARAWTPPSLTAGESGAAFVDALTVWSDGESIFPECGDHPG